MRHLHYNNGYTCHPEIMVEILLIGFEIESLRIIQRYIFSQVRVLRMDLIRMFIDDQIEFQ